MNQANGPVMLVFGATGGIGSALCYRLATRGNRLILAARGKDQLQSLAAELDVEVATVDVTCADEVNACVKQVVDRYGRVDGVAHCVGSLLLKPAHTTTDPEWDTTLLANLTSAFYVVRAAARAMLSTGGAIVLMSSAAARVGLANHEAIAAAKGGILGLTLSAAATYAPRKIRVNCVAPGLVRTPLTVRLTGSEASLRTSEAMHPLGRIGEPEEVAAVIDYLLGAESRWITGQVFGVDGGLSTLRGRQST